MILNKLATGGVITLLAGLTALAAGCGGGPATPTPTVPGTATRVVFLTQPAGATAGEALATQPVVAIEDAAGNTVTDDPALVELTASPAGGTGNVKLYGGSKVASDDGVVAFKSLYINTVGTYTLTAAGSGLTPATSAPFTIAPGPPAQLAFTTQPSGGTAGSPLPTQPAVAVQDRFGNAVTGYAGSVTLSATITLSVGSSDPYSGAAPQPQTTGATIHGTLTVPVVDGAARFTDISADLAIPGYRLTAKSGSLESATSGYFVITPAAPAKLEFTVQPDGATAGAPFETQPKVAIEDTYNNVCTDARENISILITPGSGAAGAVLSGTAVLVSESAMGGLAEFTDLSIDLPGTGYRLTATTSGLADATSQAFDVAAPASS